ncbi:MAG: hypothetical protein ABSF32_01880 [Ignavibacteria bacterium]|jgi:K+ transporter
MEPQNITFIIGIILGTAFLVLILILLYKNKKLPPHGGWIMVVGIVLLMLPILHKVTLSSKGEITIETYNELKSNYDSTITQVDEIKKEKDNISKRLIYVETKLKSTKQIDNKDNLLNTLDSIKVSNGKIDANIVKINSTKEIMYKKFKSLDSMQNIDKKIKN